MRSAKGHISQLGPNRWLVRVSVTSADGERRQPSRTIRGTRADAEAALAVLLGHGMPSGVTWGSFWSEAVEPTFGGLSPKTAHEYRRLWKRELEPRIGAEPVSRMDWHRANEVVTDISAPSVQRSAARLLRKMCNMAIRDRSHLLAYNPVDRAIQYAPHRRKRKELVLAEDVHGFMESIRGTKYEPMILLELGAGLRPEEARALLWEDVRPYTLNGRTYCAVDVSKALTVVGNAPLFKETKNEGSERTAVCGEPFASRVLALSEGKTGPLCPSGRPRNEDEPAAWYTSPATIAHNWRAWCSKHDVRHVSDASMRSSYATMMGEAMAPDSVVAGNMGHTDGTVKGAHYQRITMRAKCMAADLLADLLDELSAQCTTVHN